MLRAGKVPTVHIINLADLQVIEIAGFVGADAAWLCTEHVPNDWLGIENQIRAVRVHGIDCLVRMARGDYSDCIRPLEALDNGEEPAGMRRQAEENAIEHVPSRSLYA
jgi:4-hydroxy-2-oxoheptanedioate aldolase